MGNCISITPHHEMLNEHSDSYFARVQARNSTATPRRRRWRRHGDNDTEIGSDEKPILAPMDTLSTASCVVSSTGSPASNDLFPLRQTQSEPPALQRQPSLNDPSGFSLPSDTSMFPDDGLSSPVNSTDYSERYWGQGDGGTDGWQLKRKGHALRLRLAKNRFLQLAVDSSSPQTLLSPITLDSENETKKHDWDADFETNGMIWAEWKQETPVTAIAMSRTLQPDGNLSPKSVSLHRPLLLALGDKAGVVSVMKVAGEIRPSALRHSSGRKLGEAIDFQMQGRVRSLDFSMNDGYLIAGGDGCIAFLLQVVVDPDTQEVDGLMCIHQMERIDRIYSVQFHPFEQIFAVSGFDGKIAMFGADQDGCQILNPFSEIVRSGLIYCLDWSPQGALFAIGGSDKICAVYSSQGNLVSEIVRHAHIRCVRWNHDGSYLAVGDRDVAVLKGDDFRIKCELSNAPSQKPSNYHIEALCWSPDGSFLAIGGSDGKCLVVESRTFALVHEVHRPSSIICLSWGQRLINTEQERYLAISDESCSVALVKAGADAEGSEIDEASSAASSAYFSNSPKWILRDDCFQDMDGMHAERPKDIKPQGNITAVAFSRSSKSHNSAYLAYAADDCSLTIMTTREWKAVFQMEFAKPLRALVFSHNSNFLALGGDEGVLYVLSLPSRSIVFNTIFTSEITTVAFSRNDERLAVGSNEGLLTLLCPSADWEPAGVLEYSDSPILTQAWSSKVMAVGRSDGNIALYDTEKTFENFFVPVAEFSHSRPVRSLSFGAGGRFLAVAGDSGILSILNSKGGWTLCQQFKANEGAAIMSARWSPMGRYVAYGGSKQTCRIIDTITWTAVSELNNTVERIFKDKDVSAITAIGWSVDSNYVALGTSGAGIHVLETTGWKLFVPSIDRLTLSSTENPSPGM